MNEALINAGLPVGIVGLGAVGTSIGLALRATGEATVGYDISARHLESSFEFGAISTKAIGLRAFSVCKAVFVAVPPGEVVDMSRRLLKASDATVVDVASVKAAIADAIRHPRFVPSHPLRGTHLSGPSAGRKDLFVGGAWALCPSSWTSPERVTMIEELIRRMGAEPLRLDPARHDALIATTSHLPHVAASGLVHVLGTQNQALARRLIGGGFLDTTRIARASPSLWADITLQNRTEVSASIKEMVSQLEGVREAIEAGDRERVFAFFADARRLMQDSFPHPQASATYKEVRRVSAIFSARSRRRRVVANQIGGVG